MIVMLNFLICLGGIGLILLAAEVLYEKKILRGEYLRKFVHISAAAFIAFWPWLVGWQTIAVLGLAMLAVIFINRRLKKIHASGDIKRKTYGFSLFAWAVIACASLTNNKVFFAMAIMHLGLADGLAAVAGQLFKNKLPYKFFGYLKTVYGSMIFWVVSAGIFAVGGLFAHQYLSFNDYVLAILVLPPILTLIEAVSVQGFDNITVPVAVIAALNILS